MSFLRMFVFCLVGLTCLFLSQSAIAQVERVVIYTGHNFQGSEMTLSGHWNGTDGFDRLVRSIRIPRGYRVTVYNRRNFTGTQAVFTSDWNPGRGNWWSNRIRSIRVIGTAIRPPAVASYPVAFSQGNYRGASMELERDWLGNAQWEGNPHRIRSIRVPPGWSLTLYRQRNFRGAETTINSSVSWNSPGEPWNGTTRSIRVHPPNAGPVRPPAADFPVIYAQINLPGPALALERDWAGHREWNGNPHRVRSLRVPRGWYLVVYDKRNFRGRSYNVEADWTPLPGDYWYGKIRSIRVHRGNPPS